MITIQNKNMKHPTLKILIGISASGKSTWAKEFVAKNDKWCIVSRDDFRYSWQNRGIVDEKLENLITDMVERSIESLINRGYSVIYDATNLKASYISKIASIVRYTAKVEYQIFDIPKDTAIERDSKRERTVGIDVITRQYTQYRTLLDSFDFEQLNPIPKKYIEPTFDSLKKNCVIFDIDGTLAHTSGKRSPYDYDKVEVDDLDIVISNIYGSMADSGYFMIVLSGREDSCKEQTKSWLEKNGIVFDELFMRKTGDSRKDSLIKEEIFWEHIEPNYNVIAVFDDRDQVVKMWRNLGLKCLQVEPGNF